MLAAQVSNQRRAHHIIPVTHDRDIALQADRIISRRWFLPPLRKHGTSDDGTEYLLPGRSARHNNDRGGSGPRPCDSKFLPASSRKRIYRARRRLSLTGTPVYRQVKKSESYHRKTAPSRHWPFI